MKGSTRLLFPATFRFLRLLASWNRCPLSFQLPCQKVVDLLVWIDARQEVIEAHFENAHKVELLEIADVDETAFDLRELAAVNIPTGKLQPHRKIGLTPIEPVPPFPDFRSNEVFILHAAARGMRNIGGGFSICARSSAKQNARRVGWFSRVLLAAEPFAEPCDHVVAEGVDEAGDAADGIERVVLHERCWRN